MCSMVSGVQLNSSYVNYNNSSTARLNWIIDCAKNAFGNVILEVNPILGVGKCKPTCVVINESTSQKVLDLLKLKNEQKIKGISSLEEDWNGNGALPFDETLIQSFLDVINGVYEQPEIAPTGRNSLIMQYDFPDSSMLVFEIFEGKAEKVYVPQGNYECAEVEQYTKDIVIEINRCLEKIYGFEQN